MTRSECFPRKIFIERESLGFPLVRKILKNAKGTPLEVVDHPQALIEKIMSARDARGEGKKFLLLTRQKGEFVKPCPCTPHYIGCNYFIINLELNCPLSCTYCILQHYLTNPLITVHVNLEDLWKQLDVFLERNQGRMLRIGTGELCDSLALDHLTQNSEALISYFRRKKNAIFELKTKTVNINNILKMEAAQNVVISWSLNSPTVAREEEKGPPPVAERIQAARLVSERGFWVGVHFDPLILHSGWEEEYEDVIKRLLENVDPARIAWISLGSLRFSPILKAIIQERFPTTRLMTGEFIRGKDGKMRYFKPIRVELYRKIIRFIKDWGGEKISIYLCMENEEVWRCSLDWEPRKKEDVEARLSSRLGHLRMG